MAADNLQTVIVSKKIAKTREAAKRVAREYANRIYTSRETKTSWRFRQRPPDDFQKGSFRTKKIHDGISLVYGTLKKSAKKKKNPDTYTNEARFMYAMDDRIRGAENSYDLAVLAREVEAEDLASSNVKRYILNALMSKAKRLKLKPKGFKPRGMESRDWYFEMLMEHPTQSQVVMFSNPGKKKNKSSRKKAKKKKIKSPKFIKLKDPKNMPDPGPSSWCGAILEWVWKDGTKNRRLKLKGYWLFLWSPKYKAIVAVPCPEKSRICKLEKEWRKLEKVSRKGGAAKIFERFMERDSDVTYEGEIPVVKLTKLGEGIEVVYRSNKWIQQLYKKHAPSVVQGRQQDYYHCINEGFKRSKKLPKGAHIYCGPNLDNPEVFLCFGGKLTMTERGLVF